jgi:hypothetical protein
MRLTAAERRQRHESAVKQRRQFERDSARFVADRIMREYEKAYEAANGRSITLRYLSGWCDAKEWVGRYRLKEVERLTQHLWARVHEREIVE